MSPVSVTINRLVVMINLIDWEKPCFDARTTVAAFVEQKRRKELEIFLNRVAAHPELSGSQYFKTFLQVLRWCLQGGVVASVCHGCGVVWF